MLINKPARAKHYRLWEPLDAGADLRARYRGSDPLNTVSDGVITQLNDSSGYGHHAGLLPNHNPAENSGKLYNDTRVGPCLAREGINHRACFLNETDTEHLRNAEALTLFAVNATVTDEDGYWPTIRSVKFVPKSASGIVNANLLYRANLTRGTTHTTAHTGSTNSDENPNIWLSGGQLPEGTDWVIQGGLINFVEGTLYRYLNGLHSIRSDFYCCAPLPDEAGAGHQVGDRTERKIYARIAETVTYKGALPVDDIKRLEGYFAHTYNLTHLLPIGHPYKYFAPIVYL